MKLLLLALLTALLLTPTTPSARAQTITPQQQETIRQLLNLPPGSKVEFETSRTVDEGQGTGAGVTTSADEIASSFSGSAPTVTLPGKGSATGGDAISDVTAKAANLMGNPLLWVGILLIVGAGVALYLRLPQRVAWIAGLTGAAFVAAALFPGLMLFIIGGAVIAIAGPYVYREWKAKQTEGAKASSDASSTKYREGLRAVVGGVSELKKAMPDAYAKVKELIEAQADPGDFETIDEIKAADRL